MAEKRRGRQSPTLGFTLPYEKTEGPKAIALYEQSGRHAQEWQSCLIYDIMAVDENGLWVHSRYGFSVPRQNGKNEVVAIRELYALTHGEKGLHTAHRTATSRSAWTRLVKICEEAGIHEIKGPCRSGYTSGKSKGQEWIEFDEEHGGGRIDFRTRSTTGGLGETFDLLVIDEAQEYQDDQESALKYTIVSSENPQTIFLGTPPTPYSSGTIFPKLRRDILCGTKTNAGWAEWSVDQPTDVHDVDAWYETNPSLGYKLTERAIEDEIGEDTTDFNIQRLGLWIAYNQKSAISKTEWANLNADVLPKLSGKLSIGVKFGKDGINAAFSVAVKTADDKIFVECVACKPVREGVQWIIGLLKQMGVNYNKTVIDGANGAELLTAAAKDAGVKRLHTATSANCIEANAFFEQTMASKTLCHMVQPAVEQVVTNCEKRAIGSNGGFGYKSIKVGADIAILDSMILAVWGLEKFKTVKKQRVGY